jgi:hypothetical protein
MSTASHDHTLNKPFPKSQKPVSDLSAGLMLLDYNRNVEALLNVPDLLPAMIDSLAVWAKEWLALRDQDPTPKNYIAQEQYFLFEQMLPLLNACSHLSQIADNDLSAVSVSDENADDTSQIGGQL